MAVTVQELKALPTFAGLSSRTLEQVALASTYLEFRAGHQFYQQGDPPSGIFSIQSGQVKLYRHSRDKIQILYVVQDGTTFGAESLPNDAPSPCTAEAITSGGAIYLPPDELRRLLNEHPDLLLLLLELISRQLRQFTGLVHSLAFRDVSARLAETLLKLKTYPVQEGLCIEKTFSQQDLAAMVGTAREVIYRTLKKFEKEGLIKLTRNSIVISDLNRLKEIAAQEMK